MSDWLFASLHKRDSPSRSVCNSCRGDRAQNFPEIPPRAILHEIYSNFDKLDTLDDVSPSRTHVHTYVRNFFSFISHTNIDVFFARNIDFILVTFCFFFFSFSYRVTVFVATLRRHRSLMLISRAAVSRDRNTISSHLASRGVKR